MSYLHPVRLHFSGRFRADVSTVNNDLSHFDNDDFDPSFQTPGDGDSNGQWQPAGTGAWRLIDCSVKRACRDDGTVASTAAEDSAVDLLVRQSADRASAKIVDLDPDQQGVSMIFGLTVRLVDGQGRLLMQGDFEPTPFFDLNFRRSDAGGPQGACAYFQSVLKNVEWGDVTASPCLAQMKQKTTAGMLSMKFITDSYQMDGQQRGYGRIAGTIGPHLDGEPRSFVIGRHLGSQQATYAAVDCRVDTDRRKILVDVGNSLPIDKSTGDFIDAGDLTLVAGSGAAATILGTLPYKEKSSYSNTAGIYELPSGRTLTDAELSAVTQQPLHLTLRAQGALRRPSRRKLPTGFMSGRSNSFFGSIPAPASQPISSQRDSACSSPALRPYAQARPRTLPGQSPLPNLTTEPKTNAKGRAKLTITGVDARNPRGFIDGQVYGITFSLQESPLQPMAFDRSNAIWLLMFDATTIPVTPAWDDVKKIFKQYSNLYPRPHGPDPYKPFTDQPPSHPVVNLADYDSVAGFARHIIWALDLPIEHPSHMPVTRDLSDGKRALLLKWLRDVGADGKPRPSPAHAAAMAAAAATPRYATEVFPAEIELVRHEPFTKA